MLPAVNFHNQLGRKTYKINNIVSNRLLPLEFNAHKAVRPQVMPQPLFGIGLFGAQ